MTDIIENGKIAVSATESDIANEFVLAQFTASVTALERAGAMQTGEFDRMLLPSGNSPYERIARTESQQRIAKAIFDAISRGELLEEEFNIWSSRRKIDGEPVKVKFEQHYVNCNSIRITRMRGALTVIIRAYQNHLDGLINRSIAAGKSATSPTELLEVERQAVKSGLLSLKLLNGGLIDGWPTFLRSNGNFRGAAKLREFFDFRQHELPMTEIMAEKLLADISSGENGVTST